MASPAAATCLAFDPRDNNVVAIGMDNFTIMIYNAHLDKVTNTLAGHTKRVTSLAFSTAMNSLVSSAADAQIFVWNAVEWKIQRSKSLQIPDGNKVRALSDSDTHVQLHEDQLHFLIVHKTHLAIYEVNDLGCVNKKPTQFAVGLSNGEVHVLEPLESEGKLGMVPVVKRNLESSVPVKIKFQGFLLE